MSRLSDYKSRLFAVIRNYELAEFQYGVTDCAMFGGECVEAITGTNPVIEWKGRYTTSLGGLRVARKNGYENQADWFVKNGSEIPVAMAQFGDLALLEGDANETGWTVGLVGGSFILAMSEKGLTRVPLFNATKVFRFGEDQ